MQDLYDIHAPKKATNLSLNSDLLQKARDLKVNLSATLEQALKDKQKSVEEDRLKKENKVAIAAYNEFVAENGWVGDEYRNFQWHRLMVTQTQAQKQIKLTPFL